MAGFLTSVNCGLINLALAPEFWTTLVLLAETMMQELTLEEQEELERLTQLGRQGEFRRPKLRSTGGKECFTCSTPINYGPAHIFEAKDFCSDRCLDLFKNNEKMEKVLPFIGVFDGLRNLRQSPSSSQDPEDCDVACSKCSTLGCSGECEDFDAETQAVTQKLDESLDLRDEDPMPSCMDVEEGDSEPDPDACGLCGQMACMGECVSIK